MSAAETLPVDGTGEGLSKETLRRLDGCKGGVAIEDGGRIEVEAQHKEAADG